MARKKKSYPSDKDVSLRITYRNGLPYVNMIFRNGSGNLVSEGKSFVATFVDNNRIYFAGNESNAGATKIGHINKNLDYTLTCSADKDLIGWVKHHSDNYDLEYDWEIKMFYIEARENSL